MSTIKSTAMMEQCGQNSQASRGDHVSDRQAGKPDGGHRIGRRFFMKSLAAGSVSFLPAAAALAHKDNHNRGIGSITDSDAAILRFLAAAEILETDLWQQYTEFADQDGPYSAALENIDGDMPRYI